MRQRLSLFVVLDRSHNLVRHQWHKYTGKNFKARSRSGLDTITVIFIKCHSRITKHPEFPHMLIFFSGKPLDTIYIVHSRITKIPKMSTLYGNYPFCNANWRYKRVKNHCTLKFWYFLLYGCGILNITFTVSITERYRIENGT